MKTLNTQFISIFGTSFSVGVIESFAYIIPPFSCLSSYFWALCVFPQQAVTIHLHLHIAFPLRVQNSKNNREYPNINVKRAVM